LTASTFETCCKGARDMLANVAMIHPWILSFLVRQMDKTDNLMGLGKVFFSSLILVNCFKMYNQNLNFT
jgi:hypothetical protein